MQIINNHYRNTSDNNFKDNLTILEPKNFLKSSVNLLKPVFKPNEETISENFLINHKELTKIQQHNDRLKKIRKEKLDFIKSSISFSSHLLHEQRILTLDQYVDDSHINKIVKGNPWEVNIAKTLDSFKNEDMEDCENKFRIGGRLLYSTSRILSAKSHSVLQDSQSTQDELMVDEVGIDEDYDVEEFGNYDDEYESIMNDTCPDSDSKRENNNSIIGGIDISNEISDDFHYDDDNQEYGQKFEEITGLDFEEFLSPHSFYNISKKGEKFLASPVRKSFKKLDFGDLGKALVKTFDTKLKILEDEVCTDGVDIEDDLVSQIIPENILKKAEERRAQVEEQISSMNEKIIKMFDGENPISFLQLILMPDRRGIVQTLLYLLHLVNRQKIELWQKLDDTQYSTKLDDLMREKSSEQDLNIYITPINPQFE